MCGIFAYNGPRTDAAKIVLDGLKRLEYRGYDSWGIAWQKTNGSISIRKKVGKISAENGDKLQQEKTMLAIGHSRWATHGGVTKANAHPHYNEFKNIVVVHNGIIENFTELKNQLKKRGHVFASETDTEVIPHLLEEKFSFKNSSENSADLINAVRHTACRLQGRFAFVAIAKETNTLVAARRGSPLIIGVGKPSSSSTKEEKEYFIASDIPAFLPYTNQVHYLDDEEMVVIENGNIKFFNFITGKEVQKRLIPISYTEEEAEKGEHAHFMLKEIIEQKETLIRAVSQDEKEIFRIADKIKKAHGIFLIGCGTAGKVCHTAEYFFSAIANKHVNFVPASEFTAFQNFLTPKTLVIAVSQSGETADILEAVAVAKKKKSQVLAIVNNIGSSLARTANQTFLIKAGPEKAVASTKAATSQLALLLLITFAVAGKLNFGRQLLIETAGKINDMLNPRYIAHIAKLAEKIRKQPNLYIIGKNANFPIALEAAIKIQEVSYIHAEGFAGGELKHGPIALIEKNVPCLALCGEDEIGFKETISNAMELKARGGYIIGISAKNNPVFDFWLKTPSATGMANPIINLIPVQLLAYHLAIARGKNPDMPRNLAKSVTVK